MNELKRTEILTLEFAKEVCNNFNQLCYKYRLDFEKETLVLTDMDEETSKEVVALDDMKLFRLKDEAVYIEFDADKDDYNCCEINDFGLTLLRKLILESEKNDSTSCCVPKLKLQNSMSALGNASQSTLSSKIQDFAELKTYLPEALIQKHKELYEMVEKSLRH
ncbi:MULTISPECIES: hypothetical protein [Clostridium]|uniref:Uncharacterized protein n=1 Tax=Clostridium frigoriphilum TaxID=443253 RepID=A0ABU7UV67_9CLOT|nr:hypothetical protein [Clostridium sp. DSM 17811]MBU3098722.1 hypothetical protein [Clostridium sp. DSM 17811]